MRYLIEALSQAVTWYRIEAMSTSCDVVPHWSHVTSCAVASMRYHIEALSQAVMRYHTEALSQAVTRYHIEALSQAVTLYLIEALSQDVTWPMRYPIKAMSQAESWYHIEARSQAVTWPLWGTTWGPVTSCDVVPHWSPVTSCDVVPFRGLSQDVTVPLWGTTLKPCHKLLRGTSLKSQTVTWYLTEALSQEVTVPLWGTTLRPSCHKRIRFSRTSRLCSVDYETKIVNVICVCRHYCTDYLIHVRFIGCPACVLCSLQWRTPIIGNMKAWCAALPPFNDTMIGTSYRLTFKRSIWK